MIFGYLDPVTGSAIMQVLLGAAAVLGLGWQYIRKGFLTMFGRAPKAASADDFEADADQELQAPTN